MSEARPESGNEIRIGVLIIGSLFWDSSQRRRDWRRDRLDMDAARRVHAPIRYGRRSTGRGCSYTMVFSPSLFSDPQLGRAWVVPCKRIVNDVAGIEEEAEQLWKAEAPDGKNRKNGKNRISAGWGCVALLEHPKRSLSDAGRSRWKQRVSREECDYGQLNSAVDEEPAVDQQSGLLKIPWPTPVEGPDLPCDVLLATATNPTIVGGRYPSPEQIADAWKTPGGKQHVDYFSNNRKHDIETFQDREIEEQLRAL